MPPATACYTHACLNALWVFAPPPCGSCLSAGLPACTGPHLASPPQFSLVSDPGLAPQCPEPAMAPQESYTLVRKPSLSLWPRMPGPCLLEPPVPSGNSAPVIRFLTGTLSTQHIPASLLYFIAYSTTPPLLQEVLLDS